VERRRLSEKREARYPAWWIKSRLCCKKFRRVYQPDRAYCNCNQEAVMGRKTVAQPKTVEQIFLDPQRSAYEE
jgi:hypothetical protein